MKIRMTVMDKHRIIKDSWTFGVCENCRQNPEKVKMVKEAMVSGDPEGEYSSTERIWVCPKCGYSREL